MQLFCLADNYDLAQLVVVFVSYICTGRGIFGCIRRGQTEGRLVYFFYARLQQSCGRAAAAKLMDAGPVLHERVPHDSKEFVESITHSGCAAWAMQSAATQLVHE